MFKYLLRLVCAIPMLCAYICAMSQGTNVLTFELSAPNNDKLVGVSIKITGEGKEYNITTDENGRYVNNSFPVGSYTYTVAYGDLRTGSFTVEAGTTPPWVNLDYRSVTINFKDGNGVPEKGQTATLYLVDGNGGETKVADKVSDTEGSAMFVVPKGNYIYETAQGRTPITVNDENINTSASVQGSEETHKTFFEFRLNGDPVPLFASDISISKVSDDGKTTTPYGMVFAWSETLGLDKTAEYTRTQGNVSCVEGIYKYNVKTDKYGRLTGTFVVTPESPLLENIVPINIDDLKEAGGEDGENPNEEKDPEEEEDPEKPDTVVKVKVVTLSKLDKVTPVPFMPAMLANVGDVGKWSMTDAGGTATFDATPGTYYALAGNQRQDNLPIVNDTTLIFYVDETDFTDVYFKFYFNGVPFNPESVRKIEVIRYDKKGKDQNVSNKYGELQGEFDGEVYLYDKPIRLVAGKYQYKVYLTEKGYSGYETSIFEVTADEREKTVDIKLEKKHDLTIYLTRRDTSLHIYKQTHVGITKKTGGAYSFSTYTDTLGVYNGLMQEGTYEIKIGNTIKAVDITKDTVIYFIEEQDVRNVYFKFLHDGKVVYPQVPNIYIYDASDGKQPSYSTTMAKVVSTPYDEYDGYTKAYVFDRPTVLAAGEYNAEYTLKDYEFDGKYLRPFDISLDSDADTTIYIVIPVKRTVEVQVKDANGEIVQGVFAKIFKYETDRNGQEVLSNELKYDGTDHSELITNMGGIAIDHLLPGHYQIQIIGMERDFYVNDYDLKFTVVSSLYTKEVTYRVLYKSTNEPVANIQIDTKKEGEFFSSNITDDEGEVKRLKCDPGSYSYELLYGVGNSDNFEVKKDTTIIIYVEDKVKVETMSISGCDCMGGGATGQYVCNVLPAGATQKQVQWSSSDDVLATVSQTGEVKTNVIGVSGYVTLTASAMDGTGIVATKRVRVGGTECGENISAVFLGDKLETLRTKDTMEIDIKKTDGGYDYYYMVQAKKEGVWSDAYGPVRGEKIMLPSKDFEDNPAVLRVLASTDSVRLAEGKWNDGETCIADAATNELRMSTFSLKPILWQDSLCSSEAGGNVTFTLDDTGIETLPAGLYIDWFKKEAGTSVYRKVVGAKNQMTMTMPMTLSTSVKAAIMDADGEEVMVKEGTIFVEEYLDAVASTDKAIGCSGETARLTVTVTHGEAGGYIWSDGTEGAEVAVETKAIEYWVDVRSKYGVCPTVRKTVSLDIDQAIEAELVADRDSVCGDDNEVNLSVMHKAERTDAPIYKWAHDATNSVDAAKVSANGSATYTVTISTQKGVCPSVTLEKEIMVSNPVVFDMAVDKSIVCEGDTIVLNISGASVDDGKIFYNGADTVRTPQDSILAKAGTLSIVGVDTTGVCASVTKSVDITIDSKASLSVLPKETIMCDGSVEDVVLSATVSGTSKGIVWDNGAMGGSVTITPMKDSVLIAEVESDYGVCPAAKDTAWIFIGGHIEVELSAEDGICQSGNETVTLEANVTVGRAKEYVWWDGLQTAENVRTVTPMENTKYWVKATDNSCAESEFDTVMVKVGVPTWAELVTKTTVFEYGKPVELEVVSGSSVAGPFEWIRVIEDGSETTLAVTNEPKYSDMPSESSGYYVKIGNGACGEMVASLYGGKVDGSNGGGSGAGSGSDGSGGGMGGGYSGGIIHLVDNTVIPTVFTPHELNGVNDDFMPGYKVVIYDRWGNIVCNSDNGWDGKYNGETADAGVYVYCLTMKDGKERKGTIQIYKK